MPQLPLTPSPPGDVNDPTPTREETEFPVLERPPIVEVVCGFVFEPLDLDALVLGVYWDKHRERYPQRALQPAVADAPQVVFWQPAMRAVLSSPDGTRYIQVQRDRLYVNWRGTGESYPRFSTRDGRPDLLSSALDELRQLGDFCLERFNVKPKVLRVELQKISMLERGLGHWTDVDDLAVLLPVSGTFRGVHYRGSREFLLRFAEHEPPRTLNVSLNSVPERAGGDAIAVRIEARASNPLNEGQSPEGALMEANASLNRAFFGLLEPKELKRFGVKGAGA